MQQLWAGAPDFGAYAGERTGRDFRTGSWAGMRIIVGAALYLIFALLAGTYLNLFLQRRLALPPVACMILSQVVAIACAWVLLVLLFAH